MTTAFVNGKIEGDRVALMYRDDKGVLKKKSVAADYVSYHPRNMTGELRRALSNHRTVLGMEDQGEFTRVRWRGRWERRDMLRKLRERDYDVYEGDLSPLKRIMADYGLSVAAPRRLYFDIETDSRVNFRDSRAGRARVISWSAIDEHGNEYVAILEDWSDAAEKRLLQLFWKLAEQYDQLLAWSGRHGSDTYDFIVMELRSGHVGTMPPDMERWLWLDHHDVYERMNKNAAESGAEKQSLKLQVVAMQLLGRGKDDFDSSKSYEAWQWAFENGLTFAGMLKMPPRAEEERYQQQQDSLCPLVRYNLKDVDLMIGIEEKTGYIGVFQALCEACGIFPNSYALYPTVQMDGFMLRLGAQRQYHFATKWYDKEEDDYVKEQFEGAYVLHPTVAGIVEDVHVGDFASMYPSIIMSWNMSPETKLGIFALDNQPPDSARAPSTGVCFSTSKQGILAFAVSELLRLRKYWKKQVEKFPPGSAEAIDANRRSNAYKVAANSFFGALGNKYSRYFDEEIAESISTTGAWLSNNTLNQARTDTWKIDPIYGDTDAMMARGVSRERFAEFVYWCNNTFYPELVASVGVKDNTIFFENEKGYKRIVFIKNSKGKPAAKCYVGIYDYYKGATADESSKPEIKGLAWKRGDANLMARDLQWDIIEIFWRGDYLKAEPYLKVLDRWRSHIMNDPLTIDEVKVSQSISKPLEDYVQKEKKGGGLSAQPAHVRIAKLLKERGQEIGEGTRVEYYMADHATRDVRPAEDYQGDPDRHHLWEDKIFKTSQRLLEAIHPGHDWKSLQRTRPPKVRKSNARPKKPVQQELFAQEKAKEMVFLTDAELDGIATANRLAAEPPAPQAHMQVETPVTPRRRRRGTPVN